MTKTIRTLAALALVSASFAAIHPPALATTLKRMSVADLSRAAHTVVRARCVTSSTRWDGGEIWTLTTFDVEEIWKGSAPAQITVRLSAAKLEISRPQFLASRDSRRAKN